MSSKDVGLRIRVEKELREAFQGACLAENRNASEVLREFMQAFADKHQGGLQPDMSRRLAAGYVRSVASQKGVKISGLRIKPIHVHGSGSTPH